MDSEYLCVNEKGRILLALGSPFFWISKQYLRVFEETDFKDQLESTRTKSSKKSPLVFGNTPPVPIHVGFFESY